MPSLVGGRDMNSYDYDRGGPARMNGMHVNSGYDHYRNDYIREDMRRDDEDRYRRPVRNGGPSFDRFNTDYLDQNSLSDYRGNEPRFELDHLATFAAGTRNGVIHAEDGLRKLRQMENTTGIWTMRCNLIVERSYVVIVDNSTGEELERFPIHLVQDPTAVFKNDRREIYNNLILFTVIDDPKKRSSLADMHIFQSSKAPAQEIVDDILAAKSGQQRLYRGGGTRIPPPPVGPAPEPPSNNAYDFQGMKEFFDSRQQHQQTNHTTTEVRQFNQFNQTSYSQGGQFGGPINQQRSLITRINTVREKENIEGTSTEILERDVQLLNHCFDDIEKFVARLQQAAESYKELEKRKRDRGAKNKKMQSGDGMLNARARPPPDRDFVDIFQKFKLSFNLLAKLKAHIHDPNAPELVHFLFTPLSLIYEASRDPYHGNQNLGDQAVAPVLTGEAKQLLLNCLTSKEIELWQALGKHWTTSRDEWQGHIPPYIPEFYDGWQPAAAVIDEMASRAALMPQPALGVNHVPMIEAAPRTQAPPRTQQPAIEDRQRGYNASRRPVPFPDEDRPVMDRHHRQDDFDRFESGIRSYETNSRSGFDHMPARGFQPVPPNPTSRGYEPHSPWGLEPPRGYEAHSNERSPSRSGMGSPFSPELESHNVERDYRTEISRAIDRDHLPLAMTPHQEENNSFYDELRRMGDVTIYEVVHDRVGKNPKELTVQKGDILQVLDNSKNWWKLRNYKGQIGFAPHTILKPVRHEDDNSNFQHREQKATTHLSNGAPPSRATTSDTSIFGEGASRRDRYPGRNSSYGYQHHTEPPRNEPVRREPSRRRSLSPTPQRDYPLPERKRSSVVLPPYRNHSPSPPREASSQTRRYEAQASDYKLSSPSFRRSDVGSKVNSPPELVPPPPAPNLKSKLRYLNTRYQNEHDPAVEQAQDDLHEELQAKLISGQLRFSDNERSSFKQASETARITQKSSAEDVKRWLINKGFSELARDVYQDYTGYDMFQLRLSDIEEALGHEEAVRLDGFIKLQRSSSGYATRSAKELNDILRIRKNYTEPEYETLPYQQRQEDALKAEADYPQGSAGNSLKDQLIRQKGRLRRSIDFDLY